MTSTRRAVQWHEGLVKCNTLQHAATRCNTLQHTATRQTVQWHEGLVKCYAHVVQGDEDIHLKMIAKIVSFVWLFCKRDLWFHPPHTTRRYLGVPSVQRRENIVQWHACIVQWYQVIVRWHDKRSSVSAMTWGFSLMTWGFSLMTWGFSLMIRG